MPAAVIVLAAAALGVALYLFSQPAAASIDVTGGAPTPLPPSSSWSPPAAAQPYLEAIAAAESRYGVPANLLARQLDIESAHFAPDVIDGSRISPTGDVGIAQFQPATAAELGVDPTDPFASIDAAARYDRQLFDQFGAWDAALAAYNWGQGNVQRKGISAAPASTVAYYSNILAAAGLA
jgi:soluble lytic murein transglycosylase-like protein